MNESSTKQSPITSTCVCAIGVFDGVHLGHQMLLKAASDDAHARGGVSVAVTFANDPDELFNPQQVHKLQSNEERIALLGSYVDEVLPLHFSEAMAGQDWQEFLDDLLVVMPQLKAIHVGTNFRCGTRAGGGIPELESWGAQHGISITAEPLLLINEKPVSASRIRALLAQGEVRTAGELLTRHFVLNGKVVAGAGRGSGLGFATANIEVEGHFAELGPYVYACYVRKGSEQYKAAVSIGKPPTFYPGLKEFDPLLLEAHLIDFEGNLYGDDLQVVFVENLRPMQRFESQEELIATVNDNIAWVKQNL